MTITVIIKQLIIITVMDIFGVWSHFLSFKIKFFIIIFVHVTWVGELTGSAQKKHNSDLMSYTIPTS